MSSKREIEDLKPTTIDLHITDPNTNITSCKTLDIKFDLHHTMVDQKVINSLTGTKSTQRCYICGSTPKQFNNLDNFPPPNQDTYKYGISPLHKWIRCFEMFLHVSYKIELRKWQARSNEDKATVSARKKLIQDRFKAALGLRVDEAKQGAGNSNDGNTARRAFSHENTFASICDLDENLIHRFHVILVALSCKRPLDPEQFRTLP